MSSKLKITPNGTHEFILQQNNIILSSSSSWTRSKEQIKKNLFIIGLAWVFLFTAFQAMANLQSSLNSDDGLGTASLSTIYITLVISCAFLPPLVIDRLGLKWSIVASQFMYLLYLAANIYPKYYTLLPSAMVVGIGAGPLWTAKCTYLTEIAGFYAILSQENVEVVVNRFFGYFFTMFQTSQIIGNLISSSILKPAELNDSQNIVVSDKSRLSCGSLDCPIKSGLVDQITSPIKRPQLSTVYTLCAVYVSLALTSIVLIVLFLNSYVTPRRNNKTSKYALLTSTLKQITNKHQLLIIPLTLWLGFSLAFIGADYTKSFVACSKGVDKIGYIMICFGLSDVFSSYFFGQLVKYSGRIPCFLTGAIVNYLMIILMLNWRITMSEKDDFLFYLIPLAWGVADGAWQTQVNSLYGVLFESNQEAAFTNFRLWESLGFAISYAYSSYLCTDVKLKLLLVYLTMGLVGYLLIEATLRKDKKFAYSLNMTKTFVFIVLFFLSIFYFVIF